VSVDVPVRVCRGRGPLLAMALVQTVREARSRIRLEEFFIVVCLPRTSPSMNGLSGILGLSQGSANHFFSASATTVGLRPAQSSGPYGCYTFENDVVVSIWTHVGWPDFLKICGNAGGHIFK